MSFNRTKYDNCSYKQDLKSSVETLSHILFPSRYEHKDKCIHQLGFLGGTAVSHIQGNLVDLDSELEVKHELSQNVMQININHPMIILSIMIKHNLLILL